MPYSYQFILRAFVSLLLVLSNLICSSAPGQPPPVFKLARQQMVRTEVTGRGIQNPRVVRAMGVVPRHLFVPRAQRKFAYFDAALPLGHGQTITSPYVVAFMTEQLDPQPTDRVLEIGTGSGYQAAVLSRIVAEVYSIEIVAPLGKQAARTIKRLHYENVHVKIGDGYQGWPEHAPFDKIIVTCSPEDVPPALVRQLREGGRMIVPLGKRYQQSLYRFHKVNGQLKKEQLEATFFVPMTGQAEKLRSQKKNAGWPEIVNGGFEQKTTDGQPTGWFYVRRVEVKRDASAPEGQHVLVLANNVAGKSCHAIQAFGADGRLLKSIEVSVHVRTQRLLGAGTPSSLPHVEISFYDQNRGTIETRRMGPWKDHMPWTCHTDEIPVPDQARLATVVVGMFGATGQAMVDNLSIRGNKKSPQ